MANFNNMLLTEKGQVLYAKGQAGATINFTKLAVGIGDVGSIDPTTLTDLVNRKFDIAIQGKTVNTAEKVALISGTLTNENMTESVYIQEIGLYAQDPDDGEILYSYASAGQYGDYTSPASNGPYAWNYQVYAAIGNAANVSVTLSNLQYDTGIVNTNTTFSIIKGSNQKDINKSIDNKLKIYPTTNNGNIYTVTSSDIDALTDGYPLTVRFNADSTGEISFKVNNEEVKDVVDYFNNKVSNVRNGLIARLIYDESNANFQLLGKGGGGNATAAQILSGYTATTDSGQVTGTIPSKAAATITPGTATQTIAAGQYLSGIQTIAGDVDLIASNIVSGKSIFNVTGTATPTTLGGYSINDYIYPGDLTVANTTIWSTTTYSNAERAVFDSSGNLYVVFKATGYIRKFNSSGVLQWTYQCNSGPDYGPYDICLNSTETYIYTVDYWSTFKINASTGALIWKKSEGLRPVAVAVDNSDNVFVSGTPSNSTVTKYDSSGTNLWTAYQSSSNQHALVTDSLGNAYSCNGPDDSIYKFTSDGVTSAIYPGINDPISIAVDTSDNFYVGGTSYIYKLDSSLTKTKSFMLNSQGIIEGVVYDKTTNIIRLCINSYDSTNLPYCYEYRLDTNLNVLSCVPVSGAQSIISVGITSNNKWFMSTPSAMYVYQERFKITS